MVVRKVLEKIKRRIFVVNGRKNIFVEDNEVFKVFFIDIYRRIVEKIWKDVQILFYEITDIKLKNI